MSAPPEPAAWLDLLRRVGPPALALATVVVLDRLTRRRGLTPPGFETAPGGSDGRPLEPAARRALALVAIWGVLWIGVFSPLSGLGVDAELDLASLEAPQLFLLHGLFLAALVVWHLLGWVGVGGGREEGSWSVQYGFQAVSVPRELGVGLVTGIGAWLLVLAILLGLGLLIWKLGGEEALPSRPPDLIPWVAALPVWMRLAVSLSAGVFEELFFRGFLQPRVGIGLSTGLFVLAHASYEQPLMLVGITLLSIVYAGLVRWRQSIWAAITAHALFDAVQLLVVIPAALELLPSQGEGALAPIAALGAALW